jgi:hypothetical protein
MVAWSHEALPNSCPETGYEWMALMNDCMNPEHSLLIDDKAAGSPTADDGSCVRLEPYGLRAMGAARRPVCP